MYSRMEEIFGPDGLLKHRFTGFEYRKSQESLASGIWESLNSESGNMLFAEAPTGLGKTFAVLLPTIIWGKKNDKKILFLTASIPLQEQLFYKDIPHIARLLGSDLRYGILKGRNNYACIRKASDLGQQGFLSFNDRGSTSKTIIDWLAGTETGDISELDLPPDHPAVSAITCPENGCLGHRCPFREECFVQRMIERSQGWDVIISNYHLYFAYLIGASKPFPSKPDLIICDEAHKITDAVKSVSTIATSVDEFRRLFDQRNIVNLKQNIDTGEKKIEEIEKLFFKCLPLVIEFFNSLENTIPDSILIREFHDAHRQKGEEVQNSIMSLIEQVAPFISEIRESQSFPSGTAEPVQTSSVLAWFEEMVAAIRAFRWCLELDYLPSWGYWKEGDKMISKPAICSDSIPDALYFHDPDLIIMLSATLRIDGSFNFWEKETGLTADKKLVFDSPFSLDEQMQIWVVDLGLKVTETGYDERACRIIEKLIDQNNGSSLVLLSSLRLLKRVGNYLKTRKKDYNVLVQGELPRNELLKLFRKDTSSVLVGSVSFREGIDVPGESLSQVIIDRIPFPHPNDPLVQARNEYEGKGAFVSVTLPVAKMYLRQAVGRLIRTSEDRGRAVILDGRVLTRQDWKVPSSLPRVKYKKIHVKQNSVASKGSV